MRQRCAHLSCVRLQPLRNAISSNSCRRIFRPDSGVTNRPDGAVSVFILVLLLANLGTANARAGIAAPTHNVDVFDVLDLLSQWGPC